jgi:hypothetical protein
MSVQKPLMIKKTTEGTFLISQLKNVDLSFVAGRFFHKEYENRVRLLLNIFADDLINNNEGDYITEVFIDVDEYEITIQIKKGYTFIFETHNGVVESLKYTFKLKECTDENQINQILDENINFHLVDSTNSWYYAKNYSNVKVSQKFYNHLRFIDNILFEENTLVKTFHYLGSLYDEDQKTHNIGHVKAEVNTGSLYPMVTITYGLMHIAITNVGVLISGVRSKEDATLRKKFNKEVFDSPQIRKIYNKENINFNDVEETFISIYNEIYNTNHNNTKDLRLVHDMMEI